MSAIATSGPIWHFRGADADAIHLGLNQVAPVSAPARRLVIEGAIIEPPVCLATRLGAQVWSYAVRVPAALHGQVLNYDLGAYRGALVLPSGHAAVRMAYVSCNGSSAVRGSLGGSRDRNALWVTLRNEHARRPFHLLLHGGDQLYADPVWDSVPELRRWSRQPRRERLRQRASAELDNAIADYYFRAYCALWSEPEIAFMLANVPSIMIWDDHDIFDGWGSYHPEVQSCPVFRSVGRAARDAFALFQVGATAEALPAGYADPGGSHFGWVGRIGCVGCVTVDLRSARRRDTILGPRGEQFLHRALNEVRETAHVLVLSSVPLVSVNTGPLESFLEWMTAGALPLTDLRDQWLSHAHYREWQRVAGCLLNFNADTSIPLTLVSGEVHLAGWGCLHRGTARVMQLISSGIAHAAPPRALAWLADRIAALQSKRRGDIRMDLLTLPGLDRRFLAARTWLALEFSPAGCLTARWHHDATHGLPIETMVPGPVTLPGTG